MFNEIITSLNNLPIVRTLNMVPTTAISKIVPRWSKNNLKQINKLINNHKVIRACIPVWHEISRIQDNRRKHEKEENIWGEGGRGML